MLEIRTPTYTCIIQCFYQLNKTHNDGEKSIFQLRQKHINHTYHANDYTFFLRELMTIHFLKKTNDYTLINFFVMITSILNDLLAKIRNMSNEKICS